MNSVSIQRPDDFVPIPGALVDSSLADLFERAAQMFPANTAATAGDHQITYRELNLRANTLARVIQPRSGSAKEPVGLLLSHNIGAVLGALSALKTGKPYLALHTSYPPERIRKILTNAGACLLITDRDNLATAKSAVQGEGNVKLIDLDETDLSAGSDNLGIRIQSDDAAFVLYTSGSTGEPKGVILTHRNVAVTNVTEINEWFVSPSDRISNFGAISLGLARSTLYDSLFAGAAACMYDVNDAGAGPIIDWLRSRKITMFRSPQPLFRTVFLEIPAGTIFPDLRLVGIGGQLIRADDVNLFRAHTPPDCVFANLLYSTEAGGIARFYVDHENAFKGNFMPVGYPWPGKKILLLNEDGQPVEPGQPGEITLISRDLSPGYLNQPALTAKKFEPDPADPRARILHTGDFGRLDDHGALEFLGREDSLVKIRGYSVELAEIEAVCLQIAQVKDVVVLARGSRHEPDLKQLIAYVVLSPGLRISVQEFRLALADKLPDYMVPPFVIFLKALPLNASGKVDRRALPDLPERQALQAADLPTDDTEARLVEIWQKVFNLERVGVNDNFFDLGGDSLMALSLFLHVERFFSRQFPSSILLQYPTIRSFAAVLRTDQDHAAAAVIPVQPRGRKTPLFWIPSGFGVDLYVQGMAKHFDPDRPLYLLASPQAPADQLFLIEELARNYAREILQFFPQGPYYLVGHSSGGLIACETGRELARSGADVRWVAVLDSAPPEIPSTTMAEVSQLFVKNVPRLGFSRSSRISGATFLSMAPCWLWDPNGCGPEYLEAGRFPW